MKLSERCARLREDAVNVKSHSIPVTREWLLHFYKGALAAPALPEDASPAQVNARLIAGGTAGVACGAQPYIFDGELIVGHNYGEDEAGVLPPEAQLAMLDHLTTGNHTEQLKDVRLEIQKVLLLCMQIA